MILERELMSSFASDFQILANIHLMRLGMMLSGYFCKLCVVLYVAGVIAIKYYPGNLNLPRS